jgi:hypothetical protein
MGSRGVVSKGRAQRITASRIRYHSPLFKRGQDLGRVLLLYSLTKKCHLCYSKSFQKSPPSIFMLINIYIYIYIYRLLKSESIF